MKEPDMCIRISVLLLCMLGGWSWIAPSEVQAECRVLTTPEVYTPGQVVRDVCDTSGARTVVVGGVATVSGLGTANAAAPTLVEGAGASFSFDLAGNARFTLGTLLA